MSWNEGAEGFLLAGDYQKLGEFYEQEIAQNPDVISSYWYLSLAYLLQEKEEEAQGIWLLVFTEIEEELLEAVTRELVHILDKEATRQARQESYHLAWIIRHHLRELAPEFLKNILELIKISIFIKQYQANYLEKWGIIELLENIKDDMADTDLLFEVLPKVLQFVSVESIKLASACLPFANPEDIKNIARIANEMAYDKNQCLYAIELVNICLKKQRETLWLIKELFGFYAKLKLFDQALEVAQEFYQKSQTIPEKIMGSYQILYVHISRSDWVRVLEVAENHKNLIIKMASQPVELMEYYIGDIFISSSIFLLYLEDNPEENRPLQNYVAKVFQENLFKTNSIISIPCQLKTKLEKLRIGYVGHTLRRHSVGWLSRWLLHYHDAEKFDVYVYVLNQPEDTLTNEWFKAKASHFYNFERNIDGLIKQINEDNINILVDLDSMTLNYTCQVLAAKPAPIQVTWLGLDASGLPAIDYFIADPYVLPENAQSYYQEKIWRLPHTYLAVDGFEVGVPNLYREDLEIPAEAVIYLNMQGALKRHPRNIHRQMQIIKAVDNSYLMIKGHADQKVTEDLYTKIATEEGVSLERLRFLPLDKTEEIHRANLAMADVVLDTFPYNGATTTLEVLWMGIPLVTRVGQQFAARNSYTFMLNAGLSEGIATTDEEYVEWGIKYGTDPALREQVMTKLRKSRHTSPLWNAREFTKEMEKAYQQMWAIYQEKGSGE